MKAPELSFAIKSNAAWLHEKPRTTWEIILNLFVGKVRLKELPDTAMEVADLLVDAGYVPSGDWNTRPWELVWSKAVTI